MGLPDRRGMGRKRERDTHSRFYQKEKRDLNRWKWRVFLMFEPETSIPREEESSFALTRSALKTDFAMDITD